MVRLDKAKKTFMDIEVFLRNKPISRTIHKRVLE